MQTFQLTSTILDSPVLSTPNKLWIWMGLLRLADDDGHISCGGLRRIATKIGTTYGKLRSFLAEAEETQLLTQTVTHGATQITLCNIDNYKSKRRSTQRSSERSQKRSAQHMTLVADYIAPTWLPTEMHSIWQEWLQYRKAIKKSYASEKYERIGYERLVKQANGNLALAKEMIEQSIAYGYQGLFPITDNHAKSSNKHNTASTCGNTDGLREYQDIASAILHRTRGAKSE